MLIQRGIMKYSLDGSDGKSASGRLVYPVRHFPGHIYSGKGCVVAEGESVCIGGLPVLKSGILLCVAIDELNLESGMIKEKDFGRRHLKICAEKNLPDCLVPAFEFRNHDLDITFKGLAFDNGTEKDSLFAVNADSILDEHAVPETTDVDSSVKLFGTSAASFLRTGVEILQYRVITQPAHDMESESDGTCDKIITRKQAVPYKNVGDIEQLLLVFEYCSEALCRLIIAVLLHVFKIVRCAAFRGERYCLYCVKESRIADTGGHLGETENLKPSFCHARTSRPVSAKTWSLLPGFAEKAVVKGYGGSVPVVIKEHPAVEGAPVELLFEVLPETTLAGISMPCHRQEIQSSVYCQDQNHCLDEETFKIFSYFSSPIERGCDNRPYLVKWLDFIHNSLIFTYKVTKNLALDQILLALILLKINSMNMFYSIKF